MPACFQGFSCCDASLRHEGCFFSRGRLVEAASEQADYGEETTGAALASQQGFYWFWPEEDPKFNRKVLGVPFAAQLREDKQTQKDKKNSGPTVGISNFIRIFATHQPMGPTRAIRQKGMKPEKGHETAPHKRNGKTHIQ